MATIQKYESEVPSEKRDMTHNESGSFSDREAASPYDVHDKTFERRTIRKIDVRLLLILGAIYAISLIDRTNISVARTVGMARDLRLTVGERYSIISLVFFVPYIVFELPAAILMRKIGARNMLSAICVMWGAVMLGMAFVTNWHQLTACRVLLGLFEAGFFPSCVYLVQTWYLRYETQKRMAFFYLTSMALSGFSNIIGWGISRLGGTHGLEPWRWVFLIFGVVTIGLGIIGYFLIVDFPDKNKFLSAEQTQFVIDRIQRERGDATPDKLTLWTTLRHCADLKLWAFALCFMASTMPAYAFAYFLPVILAGGGYSTELSLCLSAPPYIFAAFYTFAVAYGSDKTRQRGAFVVFNAMFCMIGLFIMGYAKGLGVRYFGSFFAIAGCQANVPAVLTYGANNVLTHSKRALNSALTIGFGGVGGIFASLVYRQKDFPRYLPGIWATIGNQFLIVGLVGALSLYFIRKNKQVDEGTAVIEGREGFKYAL